MEFFLKEFERREPSIYVVLILNQRRFRSLPRRVDGVVRRLTGGRYGSLLIGGCEMTAAIIGDGWLTPEQSTGAARCIDWWPAAVCVALPTASPVSPILELGQLLLLTSKFDRLPGSANTHVTQNADPFWKDLEGRWQQTGCAGTLLTQPHRCRREK